MLNSLNAIQALLTETFLKDADMVQLDIPLTEHQAIAIAIKLEDSLEAWQLLKNLLPQTLRYPVVSTCWGASGGGWSRAVIEEDFFSRFYFAEEYPEIDLSPEAVIARADLFSEKDLANFLSERAQLDTDDLQAQVITELENTRTQFGSSPSEAEIAELVKSGEISTIIDLELYLFNWELKYQSELLIDSPEDLSYLEWYRPIGQTVTLLLLPTSHSWEALAYLPWFGGSKAAVPLLKKWQQIYGAELVCHSGTMLQLLVLQKPTSDRQAFDLATQQVLLAPCTTMLAGVSIREHARSLLKLDRWFLHERP
ncbi:MAG: hypothetical protein AUK48_07580 [Oscillatoriales cyanobacterium CG2_30_44_21]|nr:MAG: hypothetical protein AUK48_07580 [Oscillatoriales cyanobacterium CG2_30_44_21]